MASITFSPVTLHCQGILFDMDGILISSLGSVERSWTKWSNMRGLDPAYVLSVIHGRRAIESAAELRPDLDADAELKLLEEIECSDGEGIEILPGVQQLLAAQVGHVEASRDYLRAARDSTRQTSPQLLQIVLTLPMGEDDPILRAS